MRIGVNALQMKSAGGHSKAGLSRYASSLIQALMRESDGHHFSVYVNQTFQVPQSWRENARFRFIPTRGRIGRMPHVWGTFSASILSHKYDAWLSLAHTLPLWTRTPRVLVVHDLFALTNPELYETRRAKITAGSLKRSIRLADRLIAVSHATKLELHQILGVPLSRIDVTHLGPGNEIVRRDRATVAAEELRGLGVPWDRYLLMLSTIEPRKNVPRLLKAFSMLAKRPGFGNLGLAIAGGKGWEKSEVFTLPQRLGIQDRVAFLGYVDDEALPTLFAGAECFVLPSLTEGFGITVLEAMLAGTPVVCSNTGSLPEVGGEAVMYFNPTDEADMQRIMEERLVWKEDRETVVRQGLRQAGKFDWRLTAVGTLEALERAASA